MIRTTVARLASLLSGPVATTIGEQYSSLRLLRDRNLRLLALVNFLDRMSISIVVPLLPLYARDLGASAFLVGLIFAATPFANATLSTPFGYLSDRLNRRSLVAGGLAVSGASVVAFGFVGAAASLVALRAVDGAGTAMRTPATNAYVGDAFEERERGSAMGAYRTLGTLGVAVGPVLGGVLATIGGLALPFVVLGCGTALGGVLVFATLEEATADGGDADDRSLSPAIFDVSAVDLRSIASTSMVAIGASVFLSQIGTGAFGSLFALLLEETLRVGPGYVGAMWSLFGLSLFLLMPVGGTLADRVGRKRNLIAGKLAWGVIVIGLALAPSPLVPPALLLLAGAASAVAGPALGAIQYEVAPSEYEGTLLGLYSSLAAAGMAIGPVLGGAVADRFGVVAVFVAMGVLWICDTATIAFGVEETRSVPDEPESTRASAGSALESESG